jgi:hypothetical protein
MSAIDKAAKIATTVAGLQPQIGIVLELVKAGVVGYASIRTAFATQGHDDETLDAIIADMQRRVQRWQDAHF